LPLSSMRLGLVVEEVEGWTGAAGHVQVDDALGLGLEVRLPWGASAGRRPAPAPRRRNRAFVEQRRPAQRAGPTDADLAIGGKIAKKMPAGAGYFTYSSRRFHQYGIPPTEGGDPSRIARRPDGPPTVPFRKRNGRSVLDLEFRQASSSKVGDAPPRENSFLILTSIRLRLALFVAFCATGRCNKGTRQRLVRVLLVPAARRRSSVLYVRPFWSDV